jgi:hypothetical protein
MWTVCLPQQPFNDNRRLTSLEHFRPKLLELILLDALLTLRVAYQQKMREEVSGHRR